jgi:hypothetical protein
MKLGEYYIPRLQIILLLILLIGLTFAVYLVQSKQIFKSRAEAGGINSVLEIREPDGTELKYVGNDTFETDSTDIQISIKDLQALE